MPLYEYRCTACDETFEALVRAGDTPHCPACQSPQLERLVSLFAVDSEGTRDAARQKSMPRSEKVHREKEIGEIEDFKRHHR